jgi:aerobic-type carbon monoxide dehydrogenase small subunit (CoxS/CutS family)
VGGVRIGFALNGVAVETEARPTETLLTVLRRDFEIRSVRETCGIGVCGACTVLVDGETISACLTFAPLAQGCSVVTAEGLGGDHLVQRAFADAHAFQCGFCTPGLILTTVRLLEERPDPSDEEIRLALAGNLCRCGCYVKILEAVKRAAAH